MITTRRSTKIGYFLLDLNCRNFPEQASTILVDTSIFYIEFWSRYKLNMLVKLIDLDFGHNTENCTLLQSDLSDSNTLKYCAIVFLPRTSSSNFKLELYAENSEDNNHTTLPLFHELLIKKCKNFKTNLNVC
jgi:hypothetical protein